MRKTILKGFKKDGKFRPTEKKRKSALKKSDLKPRKRNDIFSGGSSDGMPKPQQLMPQTSPNWQSGGQSQQSQSSSSTTTTTTTSSPIGGASTFAEPKPDAEGGALPKEGLAKKGLKALLGGAKKLDEKAKAYDKKKAEQEARRVKLEEKINEGIDKILNDRTTTNEQKFRMLQRFALKTEKELTPYQLDFINKSLKTLEAESVNPQTFIGATQPNQKSSSSSKNKGKESKETTNPVYGTERKPVTLLSGQRVTPSNDDIEFNKAKLLNPSVNPYGTTTTTTTTSSPENQTKLNQNLEAEINALLG